MRKWIDWIKRQFVWKWYFLACGFVLLYSFLIKVYPSVHASFLYSYRFGYHHPWIIIYKNEDLGVVNLIQCMSVDGYRGIEWMPQYIFLDAAIAYAAVVLLRELYRCVCKHMVSAKRKF